MSKEKNVSNKNDYLLALLFVVLILTSIRIIYIKFGPLNLVGDEAYFWDWSRKPGLSYFDQGPMVAYIIAFFTSFLGDTESGVRMGAVFFYALTSILFYIMGRDMFSSPRGGFISALLINLIPASTAGAFIMTYYAPMLFLFPLTIYILFKLIESNRGAYWYLVGFLLGLGLLTHVMYWFYSFMVVLYVILSPGMRKWLKSPHFYLGALLALMISTPVLYWNMTHDWTMFRHALGLGGVSAKITIDLLSFLEFIGGQIGIVTPFIFFPIIYVYYVIIKRAFRGGEELYRLIFYTSAPIFILVTLMSLRGRAEANWPILGYMGPFIVLGFFIDDALSRLKGKKRKRLVIYSWITIGFLFFANLLAYNFDLIWKISPKVFIEALIEDPDRDPTNGLRGWDVLGKRVGEIYQEMGGDENVFIFTHEYGEAAELAFYVPGHPDVTTLRYWYRKSQYDYWRDTQSLIGMDAIYVKRCGVSGGYVGLPDFMAEDFERVDEPEWVNIYLDGSDDTILRRFFLVYRMYGFQGYSYDSPERY